MIISAEHVVKKFFCDGQASKYMIYSFSKLSGGHSSGPILIVRHLEPNVKRV